MDDVLREAFQRMERATLERREVLRLMGFAAAASAGLPTILQYARAQDTVAAASQVIRGKSDVLIVHNDRTGVMETPLEELRKNAITPKEILYMRNNQILEPQGRSLDPVPLEGWSITLGGLVAFPRTIDASTLADLPQTEAEMVLQCSGNGRSFYARAVMTRGTQWAHGGMGNVVFSGVKLSDLLDTFDPPLDPRPEALFVTAEGADGPPEGASHPDFEHSLPVDDVLERAILATHMNGEPLPGAHGGPVRLVIPGYYGTMNIKWLSRLYFVTMQTNNVNPIPRYRVPQDPIQPGSPIDYTFENSEPSWRQRVKSAIFAPLDGETVNGPVELRGVAWNDGTVPVSMVQVSTDEGKTWTAAAVDVPSSTYAWHHFSAQLQLPAGDHRIWVRAIDDLGRSPPLQGTVRWNPSGYEWNGADVITVTVS
ncbi:MAG: sulfite oxidase [Deinococcales bacterium]